MAKLIDRNGQVFGRLKVIARAGNGPGGKARWVCTCECGTEITANAWDLVGGRTGSCGCLKKERTAESNSLRVRHGHARQAQDKRKRLTSPEYRSWQSMLERCRNPNAPNFHLYGGRGICVCDRWAGADGFANFFADMRAREKGKTLDRINVDGDYTPENCRWADAKTQSLNRRNTPASMEMRKVNLAKGRKYWPRKET